MNILAVSGDVGGARAVLPVLRRLSEVKVPFMIADNSFLNKEAPAQWPRVSMSGLNEQSAINNILRDNNISIVIFTTSVKDALALKVARAAKGLGIPVICLLDNWMNYRKRMEIDGLPTFYPDVYAVMDEYAREEAIADGIPDSILRVVGQPALASIVQDFKASKKYKRADRLEFSDLDESKRLVVFISEPVEQDQGSQSDSKNFRGYTEKTVLEKLCEHLQPFADKIQLGIIAHPREDSHVLGKLWEGCRGELKGGLLTSGNSREAVFMSDGAAGMASILLYEAWLVGKPAISLQPGLRQRQLAFMKKKNGCHFLDTDDLWKEKITSWMSEICASTPEGKGINDELKFHGGAVERICEIIKNFFTFGINGKNETEVGMNVAIIPARGGSKRIPGKNIKPFMGRPIISYSIEAAKKSGLFDRIVVSTDSEDIAKVAREYGAEVPFTRPVNLADDFIPVGEAVHHALTWFKDKQDDVQYACCIFCTAPFIRVEDVKNGFELIQKNKVDSAFTVTTFPFPIFRGMKINKEGHLEMLWPEHEFTRSNDLEEAYHDAGQFYWLDAKKFLKNKRFFTKDALPIILPRYLVQDIDTPEDWKTAELLYSSLARKSEKVAGR